VHSRPGYLRPRECSSFVNPFVYLELSAHREVSKGAHFGSHLAHHAAQAKSVGDGLFDLVKSPVGSRLRRLLLRFVTLVHTQVVCLLAHAC